MSQSTIHKEEIRQFEDAECINTNSKWLPITHWIECTKNSRQCQIYKALFGGRDILPLLRSQILLFNSRKKWGLLFALATLSGMFCVPTAMDQIQGNLLGSVDNRVSFLINLVLPMSTLLIITGMYVLNDLFDADLDRINGKTKRPIPSGKVSKRQALVFVVLMNVVGLSVPILANNVLGAILAATIALIGVLYSLPKISLKDKFIIKTCAIGIAMACSLLLGASMYFIGNVGTDISTMFYWISVQTGGQFLYPMFSGLVLAMMVLVTSPLNDLGDIKGDTQAGRRTIPIVLGKENTVRLSMLITIGIAVSSWMLYVTSLSSFDNDAIRLNDKIGAFSLTLPLIVSGTCLLVIFHLLNVSKRIEDQNYIRESVSKKSMPLHLLLQLSLVVGCLLL
jgi:geranylgeranylglycerol-phosphate geranylgeranyltransferase